MRLPTINIKRPSAGRPLVGLDIEPGGIRAAQARVENGRVMVDRATFASLEPGVVRDGEVVEADSLVQALRTMFEENDLDRRVRIGVANQRVVVRHLLLPPITDAKQIETAVRFLAADELPMPIDQAVIDHVVLGPVETPDGPRLKVLLVAARRSMIEGVLGVARAAGLRPEGIDLAAFAMVRALGAQSSDAVLHLAVGGVVNLAVTRGDQCVFTRVVGGGMEAMAMELAERRSATIDEAREALLHVRLSEPATEDPLAAEAHAVLTSGIRRIAGEVRNSIDFHLGAETAEHPSTEQATAVERVVLTGSAIAVEGFSEGLSQRLSLPVETGTVSGVDGDYGMFAVAAGLAVEEVAA